MSNIIKNAIFLCTAVWAGILMIRWINYATADAFPYSFGVPALDKALEAGYIQSGVSSYSNRFQGYMMNNYAKPYDLDKFVSPYFIYRRKQIPISLGAGVRLKLELDKASLSIPF